MSKAKLETYVRREYSGKETTFHTGQKVHCRYYFESIFQTPDAYRRKWWERLFDKPFRAPKAGILIGDAGRHSYWLSLEADNKEQYLLVKFKGHLFAKPIPISCITDLDYYVERTKRFLSANMHRQGQKGFSFDAYKKLSNHIAEVNK